MSGGFENYQPLKKDTMMKKMTALIKIDRDKHMPLKEFNEIAIEAICEATEITATRKRDGQAMMFLGGDNKDIDNWMTRRAVKPGKNIPEGFILAQKDENTGIFFGWEPARNSSIVKILKDALSTFDIDAENGDTFELTGPKMQGNPEKMEKHTLFKHGSEEMNIDIIGIIDSADPFDKLHEIATEWLEEGIEGIVLWIDGTPRVKIRTKDILPELFTR